MTLATTVNRVDVAGNGTATTFSFAPLTIFEPTDLQVTMRDNLGNETPITLGTGTANFSLISPLSFPGTGSLQYPAFAGTPLPAGWTLTIKRVVPLLQNVALGNQGAYFASVQEGEFDYLTAIDQQQQEQLNRTLQLAPTDPAVPLTLPTSAARAGMFLGFDSNGNPQAVQALTGTTVSPAMVPAVTAGSTNAALQALAFVEPATGGGSRSVAQKFIDAGISLMDFTGADNTNTSYNDAPFAAFVTAVMTTGRPGFIPAGRYKFQYPATLDFGQALANGGAARFSGVLGRTFLDFTVGTAGTPGLTITDTSGGKAAFYGAINDISVLANCPCPAVRIADTGHAAAFNGFSFRMQIANADTSTNCCAIEVNGAYNCDFWVTANCGGHGDAFRATEMTFCRIFGAMGHCDNAVHLTSFYNFGNVFESLDLEVTNTCVCIDSAQSSRNTFIGGQFAWTNGTGPAVAAIVATAGALNKFIGVNFGSSGSITSGSTGVLIYGQGVGTETFGGLLVSPTAGDGDMQIDSVQSNSAYTQYRRAGILRWSAGRNSSTESGGNVGGDFLITRYSDAGAGIDNPFFITRSTGVTNITNLNAGGTGGKVGFFGAVTQTRPTVTGAKGGNAALTSLLSTLASLGLITDGST